LDTSPFIYFVERHPLYVDIMRNVFKRITDGDFEAFSSVITLTGVLVQPLRQNNQTLADEYRDLLYNGVNFKILPLIPSTAESAADLRARYNLRTPDALQIATALENGCDAFLCNDKSLKRVTELKILILDELEL
jgi:predicted nucleic acid-binding protein